MGTHTLYDVLGVSEEASAEEIKKVFKLLAKKFHPDVTILDKDSAEGVFKEIAGAYAILSNEAERQMYDNSLKYGGFKSRPEPVFDWIYLTYLDSYGWSTRYHRSWNEHHDAMYG
ncbi:MAG: DnaJ domain-containing protein [Candidatus Hydrothermarchaeales archaeon]